MQYFLSTLVVHQNKTKIREKVRAFIFKFNKKKGEKSSNIEKERTWTFENF